MKRSRAFSVAALLILVLVGGTFSTASASLLYFGQVALSGTGHGGVNEVLFFPEMKPTTVGGCASRIGAADFLGGVCPPVVGTDFGNDQDPAYSKTVTPFLAGITNVFSVGIVINFAEPGSADKKSIQVSNLVLAFYHPTTGAVLYWAQLGSPVNFPDGATGSGRSGFTFAMDLSQALAAQTALAAAGFGGVDFQTVRIGVGAKLADQEGHTGIMLMNVQDLSIPEPASFVSAGAGLLALAFFLRRRARRRT